MIKQGEIWWADLGEDTRRPVLVVQNNLFNESKIGTVVVCAITSNMERAKAPGNVMLTKGEGRVPKACVINISQIFTLQKEDLHERVGQLSNKLFVSVIDGINLLIQPMD